MDLIYIRRITISFPQLRLKPFDIPKFRGYLARRYSQYTLIHNHLKDGALRYAYPAIQFKVIDSNPTIIGIGDGIDILKQVFLDIGELNIDGRQYKLNEKAVRLDEVEFGQCDQPVTYRFLLPWMGLNQENHKHYKTLEWGAKRAFLEKILRGNLKSLSKGFDYFIPDFDTLGLQANLKPVWRNFKNNRMLCFTGTFTTNFVIPDYLGLGKQTARGFGTVMRIHNEVNALNERRNDSQRNKRAK